MRVASSNSRINGSQTDSRVQVLSGCPIYQSQINKIAKDILLKTMVGACAFTCVTMTVASIIMAIKGSSDYSELKTVAASSIAFGAIYGCFYYIFDKIHAGSDEDLNTRFSEEEDYCCWLP
ncbi:hypothetical protein LCGC14_1668030 [marine sediment metagenome]|uniref:Uncharacterized protein n=1 Tax=marine sediment metagenome TaxID=412755 RepID=A0A0F9KS58_9ZZZZ